MSETTPSSLPETAVDKLNSLETLPPRDEAIDAFRGEMAALESRIDGAQELPSVGFNGDAVELMDARRARNNILANDVPRLEEMRTGWALYGGDEIERAQAAVNVSNDEINSGDRRPSASEKIRARAAEANLRDAKDNFYANLQESLTPEEERKPLSEEEQLTADILEYIKANPDAAATAGILGRLREIQAGYLSDNEATRDEALAEYEDRSGKEYDVDKDRVKDKDTAHDEAKETYADLSRTHDVEEAHAAGNAMRESDADRTRVADIEEARGQADEVREVHGLATRTHDKNVAQDEALAEHEARGNSLDAIYEAGDATRRGDNDATRDEALAEHEDRGNSLDDILEAGDQYTDSKKWWKHPFNRLAAFFTVEVNSRVRDGMDRWNHEDNRGVRQGTVYALGALAGIAILVAATKGWSHSGGGGSNHTTVHDALGVDKHNPINGGGGGGTGTGTGTGGVEHFSPAARTVSPGEGWLQQLHDQGFTDEEAQKALPKILNSKDAGIRSWTYNMGGSPGIARPGKMSESVLKSIQRLK